MRDSHTIVANILVLSIRQVTTWSLTTVLILFAPRYLGDEGLGQISFAASFAGLFTPLIMLGVPTFLVKEIARDKTKMGSYLFNSLAMRVPLSALAFLAVYQSVNILGYSDQTRTVVYLACLTTIAFCFNDAVASVLQGMENMRWQSLAEVAGKVIVTGAGILVLSQGRGVAAYALVLFLGTAVNLGVNLSYFVFCARIKVGLDFAVWRTLLLGGFPFLLTTTLSTLYQRIDTTLLRFMSTEAVVGWYGAATQLMATLNFVPLLVVTAVLPALSRMHTANPDRVAIASRKSLSLIIAVSWPLAVGTILLSDKVIHLLRFPEAFNNSVPLLAILALNLPLTGALMVVGTAIVASDRQAQWARLSAVSVALNLIANVVGVPVAQKLFGNPAIGAATACVASEAFMIVFAIGLLPKGVVTRSLLVVLAKSVLGAVLMGFVVWAFRGADLFIVVGLGALAYGLFSLIVRSFDARDLMLVRDVVLNRRLAVGT